MEQHSKRDYFGIPVSVLSKASFLQALSKRLDESTPTTVNFLNAHCFNVAQSNPDYKRVLADRTSFLLNDGIGVELGGRILDFRFPENLNGTDLIPEIIEHLAADGRSVFLLGSKQPVIEKAAEVLQQRFPELMLAGVESGYFSDEAALVDRIRRSGAEAVIVGMGVPLQELWVDRNQASLPGVKLFVCGGAIFDFLGGAVKRAPEWVRSLRMEWAFRLSQEPRRLFRRYVTGNVLFFIHLARLRKKSLNTSRSKR